MRSLPLTLLALASLLTPATALASAPTPTARAFEIVGLALGDQKIETSGKISIEGTKLSASAGCNQISGDVAIDGDTVTIVGSTFMTEMACPGSVGDAEAMLLKILGLGKFTITGDAWVGDGGQISTKEIAAPEPVPAGSPPDGTVSSSPDPGGTAPTPGTEPTPGQSCPPVPVNDNPSTTLGGGPGAVSGSGSGSSSGGSTGTAGATPEIVPPDPGVVPEPAGTSDPGVTTVEPNGPETKPSETAVTGEPVPPPPADGGPIIGSDPNVGKPAGDPCAQYATLGGGAPGSNPVPKAADLSAEHAARDAATSGTLALIVIVGLVVLLAAGAGLAFRPRATRP